MSLRHCPRPLCGGQLLTEPEDRATELVCSLCAWRETVRDERRDLADLADWLAAREPRPRRGRPRTEREGVGA